MAAIPQQPPESPTVAAIYAGYVAREKPRRSRRLGASVVGKPCGRAAWYDFRWCGRETFGGRMLRLFATGNIAETRFALDLRSISCPPFLGKDYGLKNLPDGKLYDHVVVLDVDPDTQQQFEFTAVSGHAVCKIDAAVLGLPEAAKAWHVAEFKTHSNKSYNELAKKGLKAGKPQHYAQLLMGMALSGMHRGLYLAVNKDTDALYAERLRWEEVKGEAAAVLAHAELIVTADVPPPKVNEDADYYLCRFCDHLDRCHGSRVADVTCRSCVHSTPVIEEGGSGRWTCSKHGKTLAQAEQERACPDHLFIPALVPFAESVDGGESPDGDWVEYRASDGRAWRNGKQRGQYRSVELVQLPADQVGAGTLVDGIKDRMGGTVIGFEPAAASQGAA